MSSHRDSTQPSPSRRARIGCTVPLGSPAIPPICDPNHSASTSLSSVPRTTRVAMVIRGAIVVLYLGCQGSPVHEKGSGDRGSGRRSSPREAQLHTALRRLVDRPVIRNSLVHEAGSLVRRAGADVVAAHHEVRPPALRLGPVGHGTD